jgi:hypothetical protein
MLKFTWKQKVFIGLIAGLSYGFFRFLFDTQDLERIAISALVFALFFGLGYPAFLSWFTNRQLAKIKDPEMEADEVILFRDAASIYKNKWVAVGGKLFITNQRLIFIPTKANFNKANVEIKRSNIEEITKRKSGGIMNNGMKLSYLDGSEHIFILNSRDEIVEMLK